MRLAAVLALLLVAAVPCAAGAQAPGDTLDLAAAIAAARTHNPRIAGAAAEVAAAGARIGPAGAWADPTLTLGAMNYMLPGLSPRRDPMSMNQLTVMQMLPVNGALGSRRDAARADSARLAYERDALGIEIEHEVRTRYLELYHTDRALETLARTLGALRDLAAIASAMYAVGTVTQADVVRAQMAITRMHQQIADTELQRYAAAAALNALMGRPGESPVVLRASGATEAHGGELHALDLPGPPSLDALVALADAGNPELAGLRAALTGARAAETAARRMRFPDVGVGLSYGQRFGMNDMLSAMVTVSVPVFARSRQQPWREEALAMRTVSEERLRAARLAIRSGLATARAEAETARGQVALYRGTLVPQAEASYEASLAAYRVGRVDFLTVLDARMALLMYEHDIHRFEAMYGGAVADLDRLVGRAYAAPMPQMEP